MTSAAASGSTATGFLPASLAALLSRPLDAASLQAPIGTRSVGSLFALPPAATSPGQALVAHTTAAPSTAAVAPSATAPLVAEDVALAGFAASTAAIAPSVTAPAAPLTVSTVVSPQPVSSMGSQPPPPFHFGHLITIKLSSDNYIFWRAQVLSLLGSHYLLGYVDGSLPCPPALVDSVHGPVYNPAHRVWTGQDQANLSSIQGSLSPAVAGLVVFAKTSHEAWTILERSFAAQSQARVSGLRRQLGECQKLDSTATEFYNKVKSLADTLASIGQPLTDSEFNSFIVNGLDEEYDALVEIINERGNSTPMPAHEVFSRLLLTEQRVETRRSRGNGALSANAATKGGRSSASSRAPSGQSPPPASAPPPTATLPGAGGPRVCQLCGRDGHWASKCHKRFQRGFLGLGNDGKDTRNFARQVAMADRPPPQKPQGHTQSYSIDPHWYMDSGATEHLTSEMGKLHTREPYHGSDKIHTANGAGMHISHIGQASLLTRHANRSLQLRNVLRVPSVTRNLLSVPKLTRDNNVLCEFHPFDLFIKDRGTRDILLSGRLCQGLYRLEHPGVARVFSGVRVSPSQWHARLGHPATPIVRHILRHHELPSLSSHKDVAVCDACQQGKSHQLPFSESSREVKHPLELVFSDVWGPAQTSVSGHNYYISFVDAYSRFTWLYLIKRKSDVFDIFVQFQKHVERLLKHKIVHVQSDWGASIATSTLFFSRLG